MAPERPTYIVVSGVPGAGKTTLAKPLAHELGIPLLSQDSLMEALFDAVGIRDHDWARVVSGAAMASLLELAAHCEVAVLDAWWERWLQPLREMRGTFVELFCHCDPTLAAERARNRSRHAGHFDDLNDWTLSSTRQTAPLGLGGPVRSIDTTSYVDFETTAEWIRNAIAQSRAPSPRLAVNSIDAIPGVPLHGRLVPPEPAE